MIISSEVIKEMIQIARSNRLLELTINHDGATITIVLTPRPTLRERTQQMLRGIRDLRALPTSH